MCTYPTPWRIRFLTTQKLIMQHSSEDGTKKVKPKKAAPKESEGWCIS